MKNQSVLIKEIFQSSKGKVAYDITGEGKSMIFLHGLPTSKELWNHVVGNLENYRRINYDLLDF